MRSFQDTNAKLFRIRCTMQVCTVVCGNTEAIASGKPLSPSTTAMRMSLTPSWAASDRPAGHGVRDYDHERYCSSAQAASGWTIVDLNALQKPHPLANTQRTSRIPCRIDAPERRRDSASYNAAVRRAARGRSELGNMRSNRRSSTTSLPSWRRPRAPSPARARTILSATHRGRVGICSACGQHDELFLGRRHQERRKGDG